MVDQGDYHTHYAETIAQLPPDAFDHMLIDAPNQISPIMENTIYPADAFIIPFESTKAVKSYANFYSLFCAFVPLRFSFAARPQ